MKRAKVVDTGKDANAEKTGEAVAVIDRARKKRTDARADKAAREDESGIAGAEGNETDLTGVSEYDGYFEARNWDTTRSEESFWYYDALQKRANIESGLSVLEIGFGDSRFLDWCKSRGFRPSGVEIQDSAISKARSLGHEVFKGPFGKSTLEADRQFELIACFDVLEHLTLGEIRKLFSDTLPHLADHGRYLLRFPNGNSPFVGLTQNGDITHRTLLNPTAIGMITAPFGLKVESAFNDRFLPLPLAQRFRRRLSYLVRSVIELVIGYAYFGGVVPLDPNVFVVLARTDSSH
jgi:methyltransferase family protein